MTNEAPLTWRVLSLARGVAGGFAVRLLADLGARCSRWEWCDEREGDWPDDRLFKQFFVENVEVVRRHETIEAVLDRLTALAGSFDLLITDFTAAEQPEAALRERLAPRNPALVVANVDHFGRSGPYADWAGDELTDYALGGYWALAGDPARPPLRVPGYHAQFLAGTH